MHRTFSGLTLEANTFSGLTLEFSSVSCHPLEQAIYALVPDGERHPPQIFLFYRYAGNHITASPAYLKRVLHRSFSLGGEAFPWHVWSSAQT